MQKPKNYHWEAAVKILHYIKAAPGKELLYKKNGHLKIEAFSDADYVGSKIDRWSTSRFCTYIGGNLVTWRSKKQSVVARLSAEAEYRAMAQIACEMMWLQSLMSGFGVTSIEPMKMHCDNQAAILIAKNPMFHE